MDKKSLVFNIQHYSLHDGPGIRTTIFFKGCPLRCAWCSNPESQSSKVELAYKKQNCIGCMACVQACAYDALSFTAQGLCIDKTRCNIETCQAQCVKKCHSRALIQYGELYSTEELLEAVDKDRYFYKFAQGGLTLSGGEVFSQAEQAIDILYTAKKRRIHTAFESSAQTQENILLEAAQYTDYMIFDIKHHDQDIHYQHTKGNLDIILKNIFAVRRQDNNKQILIRTPIIPNFNDTIQDITHISKIVQDLGNCYYELLPLHQMGTPKYEYISKEIPVHYEKLDKNLFEELKEVANKFVLPPPAMKKPR